ncbi:MAG: hypothetical protein ACRD96_28050 [Bryobacteraceae bacterium]
MRIDRGHQQWILGATAGAFAGFALFLIYAWLSPNGPAGGSWAGLTFGFAGTFLIVFECLLSLRKKYPASPFGRVSTWLKAHLWLGLLSFVLILLHSGLRWGEGLSGALMWLFTGITASGLMGLVLQHYLPTMMTGRVARETLYDQIPLVILGLRVEADERIEFLTADLGLDEADAEFVRAGGVKQYFDPAQKKSAAEKVRAVVEKRKASAQIPIGEEAAASLKAHYLQEVRPFLDPRPSAYTLQLFETASKVTAYFRHLRTILPVAAHEVLEDIETICEERRQLAVQARLHRWLHGWLFVHVPLSFALLALTLIHAVLSLRY